MNSEEKFITTLKPQNRQMNHALLDILIQAIQRDVRLREQILVNVELVIDSQCWRRQESRYREIRIIEWDTFAQFVKGKVQGKFALGWHGISVQNIEQLLSIDSRSLLKFKAAMADNAREKPVGQGDTQLICDTERMMRGFFIGESSVSRWVGGELEKQRHKLRFDSFREFVEQGLGFDCDYLARFLHDAPQVQQQYHHALYCNTT